MQLLKQCSEQKVFPWLHYTVSDYFDLSLLASLMKEIDTLNFNPSKDNFREEFNLNYTIANPIVSSVLDNFLQKDNVDFLSSIDERIALSKRRLLRVSIWKDYNKLNLPMHTDSPYKLFTMQIYLPRNNETGYGTTFYDEEGNFFNKTNYTLNHGYFFFPNINKIKTNHSFVEDIKTERCSIIFNILDAQEYTKRKSIAFKDQILRAKKVLDFIEF